MFGEHPSESPKAPSPWSISSSHTPRPSTASSSTLSQSHSSSYLVNALARSLSLSQTSSDHQLSTSFSSSSRSLSTPSNPTSSSDSPSDSAEGEELFGFLDDLGTTTSRSGSGVLGRIVAEEERGAASRSGSEGRRCSLVGVYGESQLRWMRRGTSNTRYVSLLELDSCGYGSDEGDGGSRTHLPLVSIG
jgi:hypothetical protein